MYEGYIYKIWNDVNNKLYVGQTTINIEHRWKQHKTRTYESSKQILYRAMDKYGKDKFHIEEVEMIINESKDELIKRLNEREIYYISKYNTLQPNGYNLTIGGNNRPAYVKNPVDVFDSKGNLFCECESIKEASLIFDYDPSSITDCCEGKIVPTNGYVFRYHGDPFDKYRTESLVGWNKTHVYQYEIPSGKLLGEYNSVNEASEKTGVNRWNIFHSLSGNSYTGGGYYWSSEDRYDYFNEKPWLDSKRVSVWAFDINGNFIGEFDSMSDASKEFGIGTSPISQCCNGKLMFIRQYVFRYKGDPFDKYPLDIVRSDKSLNGFISTLCCKSVDCYDVYGNIVLSFGSIRLAGDYFGVSDTIISSCCKGETPTCKSFVFRYKDDDFNKYVVRYKYNSEFRKIDEYDIYGNMTRVIDNIYMLVDEHIVSKSEISAITRMCNGSEKRKHIKQKIFRWHGDSFEHPGSIDTYPHPDYEQLFKHNPNATRDNVIDLLKNSLDNVGCYSQQVAQINIKEQD